MVGVETDNPYKKVLDRLRQRGWHKGSFGDRRGPNCLVGAHMQTHCSTIKQFKQWTEDIIGIILVQYPDRINGSMAEIPNFNDHPDTTFEDVERVLEKAAVKWEEERVMRDD